MPSWEVLLFQDIGRREKGPGWMMGIQDGFNGENYRRDTTLEGPCLEISATARLGGILWRGWERPDPGKRG